jgi:hypothetical protein
MNSSTVWRGGVVARVFAQMAWTIVLSLAIAACGAVPLPSVATPPPAPAIADAISVRSQHGLRADRAWVEAVEADPASVERLGIKVSPKEAAELDDRELRQAIEARKALGLVADEAWVRGVLAAPDSVVRLGGLLVTPAEADALDRAVDVSRDVAGALEAYGAEHPDEWGGMYLDETFHPIALVTGHVDEHEAAIRALLSATGIPVELRQVRWSVRELLAFRDRILTPAVEAWLAREQISMEGLGWSPKQNHVRLEVSIDDPRPHVEALILDHLDATDWLEVTVRLDLAANLPRTGRLVVRVVDQAGRPVTDGYCGLSPDVPGANLAGDEVRDLDREGRCEWSDHPIAVTGYRVEVWRAYQRGFLGAGHIQVLPDVVTRLTIRAAGG